MVSVKPQYANLGDGLFNQNNPLTYIGYLALFNVNDNEYAAFFDPSKGAEQPFLCDYQTNQYSQDIEAYLKASVIIGDSASVVVNPGYKYIPYGTSKTYYLLDGYYDGKDFMSPILNSRVNTSISIEVDYVNSNMSFITTYDSTYMDKKLSERFDVTAVLLSFWFFDFSSQQALDIYKMPDKPKNTDIDCTPNSDGHVEKLSFRQLFSL